MTAPVVRLEKACDASTDVRFVGQIACHGTRWLLSNRAGLVVGRGDTPLEACLDALGPCEVVA